MSRAVFLFIALVALGAAFIVGRPGYLAEQLWGALALVFVVGICIGWMTRPRKEG